MRQAGALIENGLLLDRQKRDQRIAELWQLDLYGQCGSGIEECDGAGMIVRVFGRVRMLSAVVIMVMRALGIRV